VRRVVVRAVPEPTREHDIALEVAAHGDGRTTVKRLRARHAV
jgi:hypothetical protein